MEEILEDLFKIYNSSIDSYNAKLAQRVNEKYTLIDRAMIASYLYIKILSNLNNIDRYQKVHILMIVLI